MMCSHKTFTFLLIFAFIPGCNENNQSSKYIAHERFIFANNDNIVAIKKESSTNYVEIIFTCWDSKSGSFETFYLYIDNNYINLEEFKNYIRLMHNTDEYYIKPNSVKSILDFGDHTTIFLGLTRGETMSDILPILHELTGDHEEYINQKILAGSIPCSEGLNQISKKIDTTGVKIIRIDKDKELD